MNMYVASQDVLSVAFDVYQLPFQVERDKISQNSALTVCVRAQEWAKALEFVAPRHFRVISSTQTQ